MKRSLHWTGSVLAIAGIVFVALRLYDYGAEIDFNRFGIADWLVLFGYSLVYGLANLMLAFAWGDLLGYFGVGSARRWVVNIYGVSQLAKYVPGNIFHLAGRQAMGMAAGVPAWPLAKSSVWELSLISVTGGLFGLLVLPLLVPVAVLPGIGAFTIVVCIVAAGMWRYIGPLVAQAYVWYVGFLTVSGVLFVGVLLLLVSERSIGESSLWVPLGGAYVIAWLAGLVTPGAPAGLGVREVVLLFLLKGNIAEADLLLAVLLGRVVTVVGDFSFFLFSSFVTRDLGWVNDGK
jgi:uncharacterized membrane protein YbhN (UPF0104 family)